MPETAILRSTTSSVATFHQANEEYSTRIIKTGHDLSIFHSYYQKVDFHEFTKMTVCRQLNKLLSKC